MLATPPSPPGFSPYEKFVVAILAILQFTIILDFIVLSPLGALLMQELMISPQQFGWVVSAYAFSAGASGLLAAAFADSFDRKKMLLFFYGGFLLGTLFCGIVTDYASLLAARIFTGVFGGVIGSVSFAIITDLFPMQKRGRVMGFVQMAFAVSQVLGIPLSLYLANAWDWHAPFLLLVVIGGLAGLAILILMKPINAHLQLQQDRKALAHLYKVVTNPFYLKGFGAITLLSTGGFMLMPFASAFTVHNLGISLEALPLLYMITGVFGMLAGPIAGKLSDSLGKFKIFIWGSLLATASALAYCHLGVTPFWIVLFVNILLFAGATARMISATTITTAIPAPADRGAYMSIQSSAQQVSGGLASAFAGLIIIQESSGKLQHYDLLGYFYVLATLITILMMARINSAIKEKEKGRTSLQEEAAVVSVH